MSSQEKVLDLIFGRWRSQILYAGVKLGIFDAVRTGSKKAAQLANELNLDPALTYRLLRALGSLELLREDKDRTFSLTETGELLRSDHPQTLRGVTLLEEGPEHYALWKHLPAMVCDGKQNAFVREFGCMAFDHAVQDAGYAEVFDNAMSRNVVRGLGPGKTDETTFTADQRGWYWLLCGVPGHALGGEWIGLKVDPDAQVPAATFRQ